MLSTRQTSNYYVPLIGWAPAETLKKTLKVTAQFARGRDLDTLKKHWQSRFPACNVKRRNDPVATDTVFSDSAYLCGKRIVSLRRVLFKERQEFVNTLEDNIHERGAMDQPISDCAKTEVKQILRALCISSWYCEPFHQNQNFAENQYATVKATTNRVFNLSGSLR
jgi:hypothetical protein